MKPRFLPIALLLAALVPSLVSAMTIQDVVKLSDSDVGDDVIISQIEASGEVFTLTVDDILALKKAGVSDRVISFMINTGKEDDGRLATSDESDQGDVRYRSSVDARYRDGYHDRYDDPYWNVYLSWGYGGYYDPWYYSTWWPSYASYYYPVNCYRTYWPYYPPRWRYDHGYDGAGYRQVKQGREVYGRGGSSRSPSNVRGGDSRSATSPSSRTYKGQGSSNRGNSPSRQAPPPEDSGRTKKKSPTIGGRGGQSPPPSSGGSHQGSGVQSPPPASQQSGRTMKKS